MRTSFESRHHPSRLTVAWIVGACAATLVLGAAGSATAEPNLTPRITQDEIENELSLRQIRSHGLRIFSTPFNKADGLGDGPINPLDKINPGGRPTLNNNGTFLRMNGLDSQTCLECHSFRSNADIPADFAVGGVGGVGASAFPGVIDPDIDDSDDKGYASMQGRMINPPFSFGSGGVEALGKEMTKALQALKAEAQANPGAEIPLVAKGVSFGTISFDGVEFDTDDLEGVDTDLVVRPFGRTGCCATVREFDTGAMQFHHGIQPVEVVGEGVDADGDGITDELLEGELSALHIFQASLERPRAERRMSKNARHGRRLFDEIGCTSCHKPVLHTDSKFLELAFPAVPEDPDANVYFSINLARQAPGFRKSGSGVAVPLFADLKLHDMGPDLAEGDGNTLFTTARLWGIADTAPYMHDGQCPTLPEAIEAHGGEAQDASDAFKALNATERKQLLDFLGTLRTPSRPSRGLLKSSSTSKNSRSHGRRGPKAR